MLRIPTLLLTLNPHWLNELAIVTETAFAATLYWLNPVDQDKSAIQFAPGYWVFQRVTKELIFLVKEAHRQMRGSLLSTERSYITDNGFKITWGQRVEMYLTEGKTSMYGYDLTKLNPKAIPVFIREITNPCL